jgi:hypothetical protein
MLDFSTLLPRVTRPENAICTYCVSDVAELASRLGCSAGSRWLRVEGFRYVKGYATPLCWTEVWSGRRESNPRMQLGKLPFYH